MGMTAESLDDRVLPQESGIDKKVIGGMFKLLKSRWKTSGLSCKVLLRSPIRDVDASRNTFSTDLLLFSPL